MASDFVTFPEELLDFPFMWSTSGGNCLGGSIFRWTVVKGWHRVVERMLDLEDGLIVLTGIVSGCWMSLFSLYVFMLVFLWYIMLLIMLVSYSKLCCNTYIR